MKRWRAVLPLALLVAAGVALFASGALDQLNPQAWASGHAHMQVIINQHPWWSALAYAAVLTLVVATGIPASVLVTTSGGLLFGLAEGSVLSTLGMLAGSLLLFLATRMALGKQRHHMPALVERLRTGYTRHPTHYTLFLRLAPGMPWGGVTAALAWLRCPMGLFMLATLTGSLVMAIIESSIGVGIGKDLLNGGQHVNLTHLLLDPLILLPLAALALLALLPLVLGWVYQRWVKTGNTTSP